MPHCDKIHRMKEMVIGFLKKRKKRILILIYFFIYLIFFYIVEHVFTDRHYFALDTPLDHAIPFIPQFVLAYYFWFVYHVWGMLPAFIHDDETGYYRIALALFSGMTVFIVVSFIFPNTQNLRPAHLGNDIFSKMIAAIYSADTPTNIMPSIHVYNSLVINTGIWRSPESKKHHILKYLSLFACTMIILSTLFIKQHTIADIIGAFVMYLIFRQIFFKKIKVPSILQER